MGKTRHGQAGAAHNWRNRISRRSSLKSLSFTHAIWHGGRQPAL